MPLTQFCVDARFSSFRLRRGDVCCEETGQGIVEMGWLERFCEVSRKLQILGTNFSSAQRGQKNDRERIGVTKFANLTGECNAVYFGHLQIEDGKIKFL